MTGYSIDEFAWAGAYPDAGLSIGTDLCQSSVTNDAGWQAKLCRFRLQRSKLVLRVCSQDNLTLTLSNPLVPPLSVHSSCDL